MTVSGPSPAIYGCSGLALGTEEAAFFADTQPLGFILFARNIDTPDQVRRLTSDLRNSVGRADAPILIDQEGGRVQRLRAPHWREAPPARRFGDLYAAEPDIALDAIVLNHKLIARELTDLGIDVDCVPCLDVPVPGAHDVIGNRAFGLDPDTVATCGRAAANGLLQGGVLPVVKHIPGHGRATSDSHLALPHVATQHATLEATDFAPFRDLNDMPLGMTAHIVFDALDPERPVTQSQAGIAFIRGGLGFDGLLITDDLSMKALGGSYQDRARLSLEAGCDVVLHCNGIMDEMAAVSEAVGEMSIDARRRWEHAAGMRRASEDFDPADALARLEALLH